MDGMREFIVPLTVLTSKEELRRTLAMEGVVDKTMPNLVNYLMDWITELQRTTIATNSRRQFGWTEDSKSFILGDKEYAEHDTYVNHPSPPTLQFFEAFEPVGTLQGWKDMINFFNEPGLELHQFLVAASFGSPLMQFIPNISAAGLHVYSEDSGHGKSTGMLAGVSVWGDYSKLAMTQEDTKNFRMNRAEIYKNLPFPLDEITNSEPRALSDLAYALVGIGGQQRGRMSNGRNQERARGSDWSFLAVTTGNTSFIERVSMYKALPKAEAQRMMEFAVPQHMFKTAKLDTDAFNLEMSKNFGWAGPVYIQYVVSNKEAVIKLLRETQQIIDEACELTHQNRFWSAYLACAITGAIIAKRLELIDYDIEGLIDFAKLVVAQNKSGVAHSVKSSQDIVNEFVSEHYNSILAIASTDDLRSKVSHHDNGLDALIDPKATPRMQFVARYETDTKKLFIIPKVFKQWTVKQQLNYGGMISQMKKEMNLVHMKKRLSKGTAMDMPAMNVISIDFKIKGDEENSNE
jgi:hypothetical protein